MKPTILITGASRGLGRALLDCYSARRWRTFPLVRDYAIAKHLEAELADCMPIVGNVMLDNVSSAIAEVLQQFDRLDVLINNAGIPGQAVQIDLVNPAEIDTLFKTHCSGALRCTKAALPHMKDGKRFIINVTSRFGSLARNSAGEFANRSISYAYRIAKAGQNMLTISLAQELGSQGFVVCGVHPGRLKTESGARDANMEPAEAAERFANWIDAIDANMNGKCFDLENSKMMDW